MRSFVLLFALIVCLLVSVDASWKIGVCTDNTCSSCEYSYTYPTGTCAPGYGNSTAPWSGNQIFWCDETLKQINHTQFAPLDYLCTGNTTLFPSDYYPHPLTPASTLCGAMDAQIIWTCTSAASSVSVSVMIMAIVAAFALFTSKLF